MNHHILYLERPISPWVTPQHLCQSLDQAGPLYKRAPKFLPHAGLVCQFCLISDDYFLLPLASFILAGSPNFHSAFLRLPIIVVVAPYFAVFTHSIIGNPIARCVMQNMGNHKRKCAKLRTWLFASLCFNSGRRLHVSSQLYTHPDHGPPKQPPKNLIICVTKKYGV